MACELWFKFVEVDYIPGGGIGRQPQDVLVGPNWNSSDPLPLLNSDPNNLEYTNYTIEGLPNSRRLCWKSPAPFLYFRGCPPGPLDPVLPHDCINGNCLPKAIYNTPGKYASRSACEAGCAKDANCDGECVSAAEIAALQQAAAAIRRRLCG